MTEVLTYSGLVDKVSRWLNREDLAQDIPGFVMLAENRISRDCRILGNRKTVVGVLQQGVPVLAKPTRWRSTDYFNVSTAVGSNTRQPLYLRDYSYLREFWPNDAVTGQPEYYSDWDAYHWLIAPTPSANLAFEIGYWERINPIDPNNQTNWLTEQAPDAMLYATLLAATPMIMGDPRIDVWQAQYTQAIASLNENNAARRTDGQGTGGK